MLIRSKTQEELLAHFDRFIYSMLASGFHSDNLSMTAWRNALLKTFLRLGMNAESIQQLFNQQTDQNFH